MTKQKRKLYQIKKMRRAGLSYEERGERISLLRAKLSQIEPVESIRQEPVNVPISVPSIPKRSQDSLITKNKMKEFSIKQMLLKGLKYVILFGIPILVDQFIVQFPQIAQLTVGGLLVMLVNAMKVKWGVRIV